MFGRNSYLYISFQIFFFPLCCVEIIATFSLLYQVFTSTNSWGGVLPVSKGRPIFPHLSCYFCDICLGILGNALSLVCPLIRESGSSIFLPLPLTRPPLLNYVLFPQSCVLLSHPPTVFCLSCVWTMASLLLLVPARTPRNPSWRPEEESDPTDCTWKYFYSPLLPFFFFFGEGGWGRVEVPYYIILLYILICTLSVFLVICRQYDSY